MPEPRIERLDDGVAMVEILPSAGGSVTRYAAHTESGLMDYLRPTAPAALAARAAGAMACFPLVPFSNRIRNARFVFAGREIRLPPNFPPEPHAIHGQAWQSEWQLVEQDRDALLIEYLHEPDSWPYRYRARQRFRIEQGVLEVRLSITNEADEPMPAGFGVHPFFVRTPGTTVQADVRKVWISDGGAMPDRIVDPPAEWGITEGMLADEVAIDNNFVGWSGTATVSWPERNVAMRLTAEGPFEVLVVYSPANESFVCVEPATNVIDAFNLAAEGRSDTGMLVLPPGGGCDGTIRFEPVPV